MKCGENESAASSHVLHGLSQPSRQGAGWESAPRGHSETLGGDRAISLAGRPRPHCLFPPPPILGELLLLQAGLVTLVYLSNFTLLKLNLCSSFSLIP